MLNSLTVKSKLRVVSVLVVLGFVIISVFTYLRLQALDSEYKSTVLISEIKQHVSDALIANIESASAIRMIILNPEDVQAPKTLALTIEQAQICIDKLKEPKYLNVSPAFKKFNIQELHDNYAKALSTLVSKRSRGEFLTSEDNRLVAQNLRPYKAALTEWIKANQARQDELSSSFANTISSTITIAIITSLVVIIAIFIVVTLVGGSIIKSLETFSNGLKDFFSYLNRNSKTTNPIIIDSEDEFAIMANMTNENIELIKKGLDKDTQVVKETLKVVENVKQGHLNTKVNTDSLNPELSELVKTINEMMSVLQTKIGCDLNNITKTLDAYSKYDFTSQIPDCKGGIEVSINALGKEISDLLKQSLSIGKTLDKASDELIQNVDVLSKSSNEAAAALEETAAALEEITATVVSNSTNVAQMSVYSNQVSSSAKKGQELAKSTTTAMDEITNEVNLITEAITVIDQIAFQTNILSLNAAVEAATAGEAGKGFAVVAAEVRNLATRSAEAAKEIKSIVEKATNKANHGKSISNEMIKGYDELLANINKTTDMIAEISNASKEQEAGITQINDAVTGLDQQTQQNASIANQTREIALQTDSIAKEIVSDAMKKEFMGKDEIVNNSKVSGLRVQSTGAKVQASKSQTEQIAKTSQANSSAPLKTITPSKKSSDDEWESF